MTRAAVMIERLLSRASTDPALARRFERDPARAARDAGVELSAVALQVLDGAGQRGRALMLEALRARSAAIAPVPARRRFLSAAAAAAATLITGCERDQGMYRSLGLQPEIVAPRVEVSFHGATPRAARLASDNLEDLRACYLLVFDVTWRPAVPLELRLRVDAAGRVTAIDALDGQAGGALGVRLLSCIRHKATRWQAPAGEPGDEVLPLVFTIRP